MATPFSLTLDCRDPRRLAPFWCAALGYRELDVGDEYGVLGPDEGEPGPVLFLQQVPESKTVKNRMHMDVRASDVEGEARRLESLGARRITESEEQAGFEWLVMADPEGNEFCVCREPSE